MKNHRLPPKELISLLWIVVLISTLIRDVHEFLRQGYFEQIQALHLSEETVLLFGILAQIPIFMILLSRILPNTINKWTNIFAGILTALGLMSTLPTADLDDLWFASTGFILVTVIISVAWKHLPNENRVQKQRDSQSEM